MQDTSRCWVCHRDVADIDASVDTETQEEKEIKKQLTQVTWHKSKFSESAQLWRSGVPKDFQGMDFQFIAANAEQFGSVKILAEVLDAKKFMIDWLADASSSLHQGKEDSPELAALDAPDRTAVLKLIDQFEAKWKRSLRGNGEGKGYAVEYQGLKLLDGLEFLIAEGQLYYDVRAQMSQLALSKAAMKRPKNGVRMVQANGYPPVPVCSVCESLIKGLRLPERKVIRGEEPQAAAPKQPVEPIAVQAAAPQEKSPAPAATSSEQPDSSSEVSEALSKLTQVNMDAVRPRYIRDHRFKE